MEAVNGDDLEGHVEHLHPLLEQVGTLLLKLELWIVQDHGQTFQLLRIALRNLSAELGQVERASVVQDGVGVDVGVGELDEGGHGLLTAGTVAGFVQLVIVEEGSQAFWKTETNI